MSAIAETFILAAESFIVAEDKLATLRDVVGQEAQGCAMVRTHPPSTYGISNRPLIRRRAVDCGIPAKRDPLSGSTHNYTNVI